MHDTLRKKRNPCLSWRWCCGVANSANRGFRFVYSKMTSRKGVCAWCAKVITWSELKCWTARIKDLQLNETMNSLFCILMRYITESIVRWHHCLPVHTLSTRKPELGSPDVIFHPGFRRDAHTTSTRNSRFSRPGGSKRSIFRMESRQGNECRGTRVIYRIHSFECLHHRQMVEKLDVAGQCTKKSKEEPCQGVGYSSGWISGVKGARNEGSWLGLQLRCGIVYWPEWRKVLYLILSSTLN